jgi:hypothetical protein
MKCRAILSATLLATAAILGSAGSISALPTSPSARAPTVESSDLRLDVAARGGARGAGRSVNRSANVSRNKTVSRNTNVNRNVNVNRNKNVNVNVNRRVGVGVGTVRPWVRQPYFGTVVAGVTLGTLIAATTAPTAPASNLCWYWSSSAHTQGYWDYCQ